MSILPCEVYKLFNPGGLISPGYKTKTSDLEGLEEYRSTDFNPNPKWNVDMYFRRLSV